MYSELIDQSIEKVYQAGVATKILQYMGKIRNESDITQARRWVMELLQNLIRCLAEGSVCNAEGKYLLRCSDTVSDAFELLQRDSMG